MTFRAGDTYRDCDICGFTKRMSQLRKNWNGSMVCKDTCWEPNHPQSERPNRPADRIKHPDGKPEPTDTFVVVGDLTNGDFETDGSTYTFDSWVDSNVVYGSYASTSIYFQGSQSAKIYGNYNIYQEVSVTAGDVYTFSFYSRASNTLISGLPGGFIVPARYAVWDATNLAVIVSEQATKNITDYSWTNTITAFTTPPGCEKIWVYLIGPDSLSSLVYFDRAVLES
ncbi:MAG: hypothetical protein GY841_16140 [FCB group bacterium]|nr:hypothetical protein [FCB group bacterium]